MKFAYKALAIVHIVSVSSLGFSQAVNPPANPTTGARPRQGVVPGGPPSTQDPLNTQNPGSNNPLINPYPYDNRPTARQMVPPSGPAVDDRDKVSCPPGQEAVLQGSRMLCITRSNPRTQDQLNPDNRPANY